MAQLPFPITANTPEQGENQPKPETPSPLFWNDPIQTHASQQVDMRTLRTCPVRWSGLGADRYPVIEYIGDGYTEQEKEIILQWIPECYGEPSAYTPSGKVCDAEDALRHAAGMLKEQEKTQRKQRRERSDADQLAHSEFVAALDKWVKECSERKQAIAAATTEWQRRATERKVAEAQWDAYVREAKAAVQQLKLAPAPPRPVKGGTEEQ